MKRRDFCMAASCVAIGGFCPSSLQGFLPHKKTHACPDAYNPVVFEIMRVREKEKE